MPNVDVWNGFLVMVYDNDHEPAHVHVKKNGWNSRVFLFDLSTNTKSGRPKKTEIKAAVAIVADHLPECRKAWKNRKK